MKLSEATLKTGEELTSFAGIQSHLPAAALGAQYWQA